MKVHTMAEQIATHPFLRDMPAEQVSFLAGCAANTAVSPDEYLFQEGQDAGSFYLVREGRVSLEIHVPGSGKVILETLGPGDVIGWSWLLSPYRWHFDARALDVTRLYLLDGVCLREKCERDHDLGYEVVKRFLYVVQERLERVRLQLLDVYRS